MAVKVSAMTIAIQAAMDCYYFVRSFVISRVISGLLINATILSTGDHVYNRRRHFQSLFLYSTRLGFRRSHLIAPLWNALLCSHQSYRSCSPTSSVTASSTTATHERRIGRHRRRSSTTSCHRRTSCDTHTDQTDPSLSAGSGEGGDVLGRDGHWRDHSDLDYCQHLGLGTAIDSRAVQLLE